MRTKTFLALSLVCQYLAACGSGDGNGDGTAGSANAGSGGSSGSVGSSDAATNQGGGTSTSGGTGSVVATSTGAGGAVACSTTPSCNTAGSQGGEWNAPGNRNPIVPGYFADGTVRKFGDTYYLYSTTDGVKNAAGDPTVWVSKDFVNWYNVKLTIPTGDQSGPGDAWAWWAPDVLQSASGTYYFYHANSNTEIYGASSSSPTGPWTALGTILTSNYVAGALTLDAQTFTDDDGSIYAYFCTWASTNSGCGWAKFNSDLVSFSDRGLITNAELGAGLSIGEAPLVLHANDRYYFMYSNGSCFDGSYEVRYSTGSTATGPFTYAKSILSTNDDDTVNGPGHHSILQEGSDYYIIYHRHDNPHSTGGEFRQECADRMTFDANGAINVITPTHTGIGYLGPDQNPTCDLAFQRTVTASSSYSDSSRDDFEFAPEYAVDDNNATLWKAGDAFMGHWLQLDLGQVQNVARVMTQFEYSIYYYQYLLETSTDGTTWTTYADRSDNRIPGSPMVDTATACARYVRIRITGVEKPGQYAAIFNIRVFGETTDFNPTDVNAASAAAAAPSRGNLLVSLDASTLSAGSLSSWSNAGSLAGTFAAEGGAPTVSTVSGRQAVTFSGSNRMRASFTAPTSVSWQSPFTTAGWFYNPTIGERECLFSWADRGGPQAAYAAMMYGTSGLFGAAAHWDAMDMPYGSVPSAGAWHHIALVYDGQVERVYVDGDLDAQEQKYLQVWPNGAVLLGDSGETGLDEHFSGHVASFRMYDVALDAAGVAALMNGTEPTLPTPPAEL